MTVLNAIRRAGAAGRVGRGGGGGSGTGVVAVSGTRAAIVGAAAAGPRRFDVMANIASQKKRILRTERERLENRRYTSTVKTYFRRLQAAVEAGEDETADAEHRQLVRTVDKAVKRGALHKNAGARKKSRAAKLRRGASA